MGTAFTEEEKVSRLKRGISVRSNHSPQRFVLSEMIKQSGLDLNVLVDFVRGNGIDPDWHAMQVPGGSSDL